MFDALKKILRIGETKDLGETETSLFSGSAYFSNRVPTAFIDKWVAHGGQVSSGTSLDVRARYFFAIDPSEPWVTKLFAKSVVVIHAGWIMHCADKAFQVPITEYILDDRFIPGSPYKLTAAILVPLSEPSGSIEDESGESGPPSARTSDTPSTPTVAQRKCKREQAYFDSPSGSLVFSGFDKDGLPRRPRKQRKLRFDPSFSPEGGKSRKITRLLDFDVPCDSHENSGDEGDVFSVRHTQDAGASTLYGHSHMITVRSPDTPDKPLACERLCRHLSFDEHLSKPTHLSSPPGPVNTRDKIQPVRTIDFTNLPPPSRRRRFPQAGATSSSGTGAIVSIVKSDHKVKTPKKISFADQAQVCVYAVSSPRLDAKDEAGPDVTPFCLGEAFEEGLDTNGVITDLGPQIGTTKVDSRSAQFLGGVQSKNDTLTLTKQDVQAMRCRLLELAARNGVDDGQLATLFELGKTFRGMNFRHVW